MADVAGLTIHSAKKLWPGEAQHFNPWLAQHLDALDHALDPLTLSEGNDQQPAGNLWVDIVAQTPAGSTACIEAQFGTSDHDHLGKLLTYVAAYDARVAIWIAEEPKPEHVNVLNNLNARYAEVDFYLLRLEVVSIGDNPTMAPLFSRVVGPSPVIKTAKTYNAAKQELRNTLHEFWSGLLVVAAPKVPLFAGKPPSHGRWFRVSAGRQGVLFRFGARQHDAECALTIRGGRFGDAAPVLSELEKHRAEIETSFGASLDWVPGTRCHVRAAVPGGGYLDKDKWPTLYADLSDTMARLVKAFAPTLSTLTTRPATPGGVEDDLEDDDEE